MAAIASRPATSVSASDGRKIQVAMPPIAARSAAVAAVSAGSGSQASSTKRHAIAPIIPIAPMVCRNFIR
jgi:hypothetical protein